ncbi:unnamed protein product, partial [Chrysoparadoxa australica]
MKDLEGYSKEYFCPMCRQLSRSKDMMCELCPFKGTAPMKHTAGGKGKAVHVLCALWLQQDAGTSVVDVSRSKSSKKNPQQVCVVCKNQDCQNQDVPYGCCLECCEKQQVDRGDDNPPPKLLPAQPTSDDIIKEGGTEEETSCELFNKLGKLSNAVRKLEQAAKTTVQVKLQDFITALDGAPLRHAPGISYRWYLERLME